MEDYKKKYEDALERAKVVNPGTKNYNIVTTIFPELKESEDERIRKEIIQFLQLPHPQFVGKRNQEKWIAWLEKQDQKKHEKELENAYKCADEVQYRRGYEDAKREFESQDEQKSQGKSVLEVWKDMRFEVYQQASGNRHEPNYSDDSTKMFSLTNIDEIFEKVAEKQGEQKLVYVNDNAKEMFIKALECVEEQNNKGYKLTDCDKNSWWEDFKAYTSCIIEQKPAWSEEDERYYDSALWHIKNSCGIEGNIYNWLKSLKEKYTWKPSDEQMKQLGIVATGMGWFNKEVLSGLLEQLKKLREIV